MGWANLGRRNYSTKRVIKHWNGLSLEAVESPSLKCLQNTGHGTQLVFSHRMDWGISEVFPSTADPVTPRRDSGAPGAALTHNMDPPLPFCGRCSPRAPDTGTAPPKP